MLRSFDVYVVTCNHCTPGLTAIRWMRVICVWKQLIFGVSYAECYLQLEIKLATFIHFWEPGNQ